LAVGCCGLLWAVVGCWLLWAVVGCCGLWAVQTSFIDLGKRDEPLLF
jgi:hypothetical protein